MTDAMLNDSPYSTSTLPLPPRTDPLGETDVIERVNAMLDSCCRENTEPLLPPAPGLAGERDVIERVEAVFGSLTDAMFDDSWSSSPALPLPPTTAHPCDREAVERVEAIFADTDSLWELLEAPEPAAPPAPTDDSSSDMRVSVVIPTHNQKTTVLDVIAGVRSLPFETEIIVVDDASTDGTPGWLETIRGASGLQVILKDAHEGRGAALRDGIAAATGNIIVVQDAGMEYDPRDIEKVVRPIVAGDADVVYGSRYLSRRKTQQSISRRFANWALTKASNAVSGLGLTDMETNHKAFRAAVLRGLPLAQNRAGFEPEVTAKLARRRYRVVERSVQYRPRPDLQSRRRGVRDALNAVYCIGRYGWRD